MLIRLTPNGRHEPGSPLQDAEHSARSTEMDLIHRRSTSRITFRRERTTETWSLATPNQSEAIVGTEKSKIPGGCQALGVNRISMLWTINYNRIATLHRSDGVSLETVADIAHVIAESKAMALAAFGVRYPDALEVSIRRLLLVDIIVRIA